MNNNSFRRFATNAIATIASLCAIYSSQAVEPIDDSGQLFGEWEISGMVFKGKKQENNDKPFGCIKLEKNWLTLTYDEKRSRGLPYQCKIVGKHIDYNIDGNSRVKGIFEWRDNGLWMVFGALNGERPKDFIAEKNPETTLYVLRKVSRQRPLQASPP